MLFYDIAEFGAKGDGTTLDTMSIQATIDACADAGGGRVVCGPGVYLSGSLTLRSNVELRLSAGCELRGSSDINHYDELVSEGLHNELAAEGTHFFIGVE